MTEERGLSIPYLRASGETNSQGVMGGVYRARDFTDVKHERNCTMQTCKGLLSSSIVVMLWSLSF
ncbi:hypothetical protein L484_015528 [Morus notabilis]|uniref:Uncharacterized protein n=1 Tax=Morus notabilis TaxID=981085 RepID=W9RIV7_9ROSA|nr:hypothetical protein L484_015528 [Morus notabilis]